MKSRFSDVAHATNRRPAVLDNLGVGTGTSQGCGTEKGHLFEVTTIRSRRPIDDGWERCPHREVRGPSEII